MTISNEELLKQIEEKIEKTIQTSDFSTGGKLNSRQADAMIDFVFDETGLSGSVRLVRMRAEQFDIDKIVVGNRVAMAKSEATTTSVRRAVTLSKVSLNKKAIMVPWEISEEYLEDGIEEGKSAEDHIARMMGTQLANNLEDLYINGNTLGPAVVEGDIRSDGATSTPEWVTDSFLGLMNGWLTILDTDSSTNLFNAASANISSNIFSKMINQMPDKFRRRLNMLRFFLPMDIEQNYRQALSARGTALGDAAIQGNERIKAFGVELVPLILLSTNPKKVVSNTLPSDVATALGNGDTNITGEVGGEPVSFEAALIDLALPDGSPIADVTGAANVIYDLVAGTAEAPTGSSFDGEVVETTYNSQSNIILAEARNLILGIGRDITIKRDQDIYADTRQFAMTVRVAVQIEEIDACVLAQNVANG